MGTVNLGADGKKPGKDAAVTGSVPSSEEAKTDLVDVNKGRGQDDPSLNGEDSLVGSEIYVDSEVGGETTTNSVRDVLEELVPEETKAVVRARSALWFVWGILTIVASVSLYYAHKDSQTEAFEAVVEESALHIGSAWLSNLHAQLQGLQALAVSLTSFVAATSVSGENDTWPTVILPDFGPRASSLLNMGATSVGWAPVIQDDIVRDQWEAFAVENAVDWVDGEGHYFLGKEETTGGAEMTEASAGNNLGDIASFIYSYQDRSLPDQGPTPYLTMWQNSPVSPSLVNLNLRSHPTYGPAMDVCLVSDLAVLSDSTMDQSFDITTVTSDDGIPTYALFYPVFDSLNVDDRSMVGSLVLESAWNLGVGADSTLEMTLVLENSCGTTLTYQVSPDGKMIWMGDQDLHDTSMDDYEHVFDLSSMNMNSAFPPGSAPLAMQDDYADVCSYILRVYPLSTMEDSLAPAEPTATIVAVVVGVAVLLGLVIWNFQRSVETRHHAVTHLAQKSKAIVGNLFPANVHDRLFESRSDDMNLDDDLDMDLPLTTHRHPSNVTSDDSSKMTDDLDLKPFNPLDDVDTHASLTQNSQGSSMALDNGSSDERSLTRIDMSGEFSTKSPRTLRGFQRLSGGSTRRLGLGPLSSGNNNINDADSNDGSIGGFSTLSRTSSVVKPPEDKPIADLFPDATVLFADLAG